MMSFHRDHKNSPLRTMALSDSIDIIIDDKTNLCTELIKKTTWSISLELILLTYFLTIRIGTRHMPCTRMSSPSPKGFFCGLDFRGYRPQHCSISEPAAQLGSQTSRTFWLETHVRSDQCLQRSSVKISREVHFIELLFYCDLIYVIVSIWWLQ